MARAEYSLLRGFEGDGRVARSETSAGLVFGIVLIATIASGVISERMLCRFRKVV